MSNRLSNCDGIACLVCGLLIQMKVYPTTPPPWVTGISSGKNKPSAPPHPSNVRPEMNLNYHDVLKV